MRRKLPGGRAAARSSTTSSVKPSARPTDRGSLPSRTSAGQLEGGSRARTVSHREGPGPLHGTTSEDVVTGTQSLAYQPASEGQPARIIRYRVSDDFATIPEDPPPFDAPPIGGSSEVGDPRDVPDRLAAGGDDVTRLPDGTVRDIAVQQFQVGDCGESTSTERNSTPPVVTVPQRAIVALARDTLTPVRVTLDPCPGASRSSTGSRSIRLRSARRPRQWRPPHPAAADATVAAGPSATSG